MTGERLYERAAASVTELAPLWHVGDGSALFAGPLQFNAPHRHSVPVYIAGLYAPFGLQIAGENWVSCRTAVVPAGTSYALDVGGNALAVFYPEPHIAGAEALAPLVRNAREMKGVLVGAGGETLLLRELFEDGAGTHWAGSALADLLAFSKPKRTRTVDPRIARATEWIRRDSSALTAVAGVAECAGLSPSRFQHIFSKEVGVPFRRYRAWARLRSAIREIVGGSSFTAAAHAAGFADQAHFAHTFRQTFGAPASGSLRRVRA
jgi:AraC-like DNA-binding protein